MLNMPLYYLLQSTAFFAPRFRWILFEVFVVWEQWPPSRTLEEVPQL